VANASQKGIYLQLSSIPVIEDALEYAAMGLVPGGARANRQFYLPHVEYQVHISPEMQDILYDPQTSGGLLVFVAQEKVNKLLDNFKKEAVPAYLIGEVTDQSSAKIIIGN
jgi:selenide,water dikinase